ncbi:hypothetical protein BB560_001488 [Smittium megazygosporum]|uniref:Methionine aminopeptidase n=1 Tax=Smittium megazygosporum TaxID=133381 RepID=A0A2T9ZHF6_9FUNG|nr:hypothetical protein BB560_005714 [Smittium megazygosporum]PVV04022.1 hypothetical protein BB560_001488 [Smittium megazygosporum]
MQKNKCSREGCSKDASFQCPVCLKLKLDGYFCSQECFKLVWPSHKLLHVSNSKDATYDPFPSFRYTGKLRACYPLSPKRIVPDSIPRPDYAESGISISEQKARSTRIQVLSPKEIEGMRTVCRLAREVLDIAARALKVGITTDEIDEIVHNACIVRNSYPSPLNYYNFPKSVCTSINEVICHGIPDKTVLKDGDIVNIDVTLYHNGFHGDLNETYIVGDKIDENGKKLVKVTKECLDLAIKMVKPGVLYRDLGSVIDKNAKKNGFSVVRTYCGHGINSLFHCAPNVPHYANNKTPGVIKPGHVFTIEPMINEGSYHDTTWPDNWTAATRDGKRSAQFEHTLLVTENGCEVLTARLPDSPGI